VIPSAPAADIGSMRRWSVILPVCLLASCSAPPASDELQITTASGVASSPTLSRDGAEVAFAASADGHASAQIWVRRVDASTAPLRLTDDSSQNYDPEFSPDGKCVYFTSTRSPQGIYREPVSGGTPELIVEKAVSAKISPDGKTLLYGIGGRLYQRALGGGPAAEVLPAIENSYAPVWSPDGVRILVTAKNRDEREAEWWIAQAAGGEPRKTSIVAGLRAQGFNSVSADAWLPGDWIVFSGLQGETRTLWKVQIGSEGEVLGKAVRATDDAQGDSGASFAAGKLVFARTRVDTNLWALPLDSTGEHLTGPPEPLTSSPARKGQESAAGSKLLYSAEDGDRFSLVLKDGRKEKVLRDGFYSVLAPNGASYVYGEGTKDRLNVRMKSVSWWPFWSTALCEACGMPRGLSPDGKKLLLWDDSPPITHLDMLDLATHQVNRIVWAGEDLTGPRLSPDGRWVSFVANVGEHQWQTFVAPVWQEKLLGSFDWVPITPVSDSFHFAFWSARGDLLYILTAHGGSGNLRWLEALRLDAETKRPMGAAMPVYEFDDLLVPGMDPIWNTVSVVDNRIILELGGVSTNIWIK
jgi:Tol biopolymer transport system component